MYMMDIHEPGETPMPHEGEELAIGIDLGTTHSVVALARPAVEEDAAPQVEVLLLNGESALVPSIVSYGAQGEITVGEQTKYAAKNSVLLRSVKRLMGRGLADLADIGGSSMFPVDESAPTGAGIVALKVPQGRVTPVEVSAEILRYLKTEAETHLGKTVSKAVITVPAYFDDAARLATRDAARVAGLEVLRLVNEPTAAALAYGLDQAAEGVYAIYDLGGGTFDLSLLRLERGVFQVLATAGDIALGGDDLDYALLTQVLGEDALKMAQPAQIEQWMQAARRAKERLSETTQTTLLIDDMPHPVSQVEFQHLVQPFIQRTLDICTDALEDADLTPEKIQGVVMVGGSTRIPAVRAAVEAYFGQEPLTDANPDEVVAAGAALQALALTQGGGTLLLDVTPLSLGLETMGGLVEKLIYRNTPIPAAVAQEFTTHADNQNGMIIHVLQGEREMVDQCRSLARFELRGIPPLPAGIARVEVRFSLDADGLLSVGAREITTGTHQEIQVKPSYGLEEGEIERMLRESMEHARADMAVRLLTESRVNAERVMTELESAVKSSGHLVKPGEKAMFESQGRRLRDAMAGTDRESIDYETEELSKLSRPFAERRMDNAILDALQGADIDAVVKDSA